MGYAQKEGVDASLSVQWQSFYAPITGPETGWGGHVGILSAIMFSVIYHNSNKRSWRTAGFTLVEAIVAISVLGIGVAATLGALTKVNAIASTARNATGAQTVAQNQVDLLLSDGPFNPQKTSLDTNTSSSTYGQQVAQIPPELTVGTHTTSNVPIYKEPTTGIIVSGTLTWVVTDVTGTYNSNSVPMYACTVTVTYTYLSKSYTATMNTIRVCDT